jgi:aldehyde:ferredoxin oxidoreductase
LLRLYWKLLFVDLTSRTFEIRELDEKTARDYVGAVFRR